MPHDLERLKPVWHALSELYLDTELSHNQILKIIQTLKASDFSLKELKQINQYHVFPVLHVNMVDTAGVWSSFDEVWLFESIIKNMKSYNIAKKYWRKLLYYFNADYFDNYWKTFESYW